LTSSGSAYARFRRALATGNVALVAAAAAELPSVSLADALEVCLAFRDDPERYARAAVRWHGRLCLEARGMTAAEAHLALSCLQALPTRSGQAAAGTLAEVCRSHGLSRAAAALDRFAAS